MPETTPETTPEIMAKTLVHGLGIAANSGRSTAIETVLAFLLARSDHFEDASRYFDEAYERALNSVSTRPEEKRQAALEFAAAVRETFDAVLKDARHIREDLV